MANGPLDLIGYLRGLAAPAGTAALPDADLLRRFARQGDAAAFTALVQRHGPLVLGVCRRVLRHAPDVEDAFQATFLVLARRAGSLARPERLGGWLHGVALRTARKARARAARRPQAPSGGFDDVPAAAEGNRRELYAALDEELARLPEKYRGPLILCYLEGRTRDEAARQLGQGEGAVKGLLERGRQRLRQRLAQRGLDAGALPLAPNALAVPAALLRSAARAAPAFAAGQALRGPAAALAERVIQNMGAIQMKPVLALLLLLGLAGAGAGLGTPASPAPGPTPYPLASARPLGKASLAPVFRAPVPPAPPRPLVLKHPGPVCALAYSPDGKHLATAAAGIVRLWDVQTGKEAGQLKGHTKAVRALAFSRDGQHVATADEGGTVLLWDAGKRAVRRRSEASTVEVLSLAFTPDGKGLATGGPGGSARLWDVETGKLRGEWRGKDIKEGLLAVAFSPDGSQVLLGGEVALNEGTNWNTFYLRDARTGKDIQTATGPRQGIDKLLENSNRAPPLAFAPDGKAWAAAASDHTILLGAKAKLAGHGAAVTALVFLRDGKTLASAGLDDSLRFWDVAKALEVARATRQGRVLALALSPDGKALASAHADGSVRVRAVRQLLEDHRLNKKKPGR
jgi:RNA polymerase sigma factor (sigma-70 family)